MSTNAIVALTIIGLWIIAANTVLIIALTRRPKRVSTERQELNNVTALFNTLPAPKNSIPSTLRKADS